MRDFVAEKTRGSMGGRVTAGIEGHLVNCFQCHPRLGIFLHSSLMQVMSVSKKTAWTTER